MKDKHVHLAGIFRLMALAAGLGGGVVIGFLLTFAGASDWVILVEIIFGSIVGYFGPRFANEINDATLKFEDCRFRPKVCDAVMAVVLTVAASALWSHFAWKEPDASFLVFLAPVVVSSLISRRAGAVAAVLSVIGVEYYYIPPSFSFALYSYTDVLSTFFYACSAFSVCFLTMFQRDLIVLGRRTIGARDTVP
jgi:hypothetical protein